MAGDHEFHRQQSTELQSGELQSVQSRYLLREREYVTKMMTVMITPREIKMIPATSKPDRAR